MKGDGTPTDGSGAALLLFLEWAGRTGELNPTTAGALRSTVRTVLSVEPTGLGTEVTSLDVNAVLDRFENLNRTRLTTGSMGTYRSRFAQAIAMYDAWLKKDPAWKSAGKASAGKGTSGAAGTRKRPPTKRAAPAKGAPRPPADPFPAAEPGTRLVAYDLPLRPDLIVRMTLPVDLSPSDAERIAAFVRSLAFTDTGA